MPVLQSGLHFKSPKFIFISILKLMKKLYSRMAVFCLITCINVFAGYSQTNAMAFDGIDDHVLVPHHASLNFNITDNFSIEGWIKTSSGIGIIFSKMEMNSTYKGYDVTIQGGKLVFSLINNYPGNCLQVEANTTVTDGNWHHIACVYRGVPNISGVDMYIDGILQVTGTIYNNLSSAITNVNPVAIGARQDLVYKFTGTMDEIRVWNKALCPGEVSAKKNCHLTGSETNLVAYYNFNQGTAGGNNTSITTLTDLTGVHNGAITNMTLTGTTSNFVTSTNSVSGTCAPFGALAVSGNTNMCAGTSQTLIATGANSYTWSTGVNTNSIVITPSVTTSYTVNGTDANGCKNGKVITIAPGSATASAASSGSLNCVNTSVTLSGSGVSTYTWAGPSFSSNSANPGVTSPGIYSLTGTNNGCVSNTATISVIANTTPPTLVLSANPNPICSGSTLTITANGANVYNWNTGSAAQAIAVSPTVGTNYFVNGTNTSNGCMSTANIFITVYALPSATVSASPAVICAGNTSTLNVVGSGGTGPLSYSWTTGTFGQTSLVSPSVSTTYTSTVSDGNNCIKTNTINVFVNASPIIPSITANALQLTSSAATNNQWYLNGSPINGATNQNYFMTGNGSYMVCVTNVNNCQACSQIYNMQSVGISELINNHADLQLYPNPNNGMFTIHGKTDSKVFMINEIGQMIRVLTLNSDNNHTVLIEHLSQGIYFLTGENIKQKVIVLE